MGTVLGSVSRHTVVIYPYRLTPFSYSSSAMGTCPGCLIAGPVRPWVCLFLKSKSAATYDTCSEPVWAFRTPLWVTITLLSARFCAHVRPSSRGFDRYVNIVGVMLSF